MKPSFYVLAPIFFSALVLHEQISAASETVSETLAAIPAQRAARPITLAVDAALFETWVITKYGVTASYNESPENTYELGYQKGSLGFGYFGFDLGKIEEQKVSLLWRSYSQRNTFSFFTGLNYNVFKVHLGNDYLETVTGSERANVDVVELTTLGATWGFGQRWHTKSGMVWGVDWFNISVPVVVLHERMPFAQASNSADKRDSLNSAAKVFKRIPSVGILKIQIGFSF